MTLKKVYSQKGLTFENCICSFITLVLLFRSAKGQIIQVSKNQFQFFFAGVFGSELQAPRFITQPSASGSIVAEGRTKILQCQALGKKEETPLLKLNV